MFNLKKFLSVLSTLCILTFHACQQSEQVVSETIQSKVYIPEPEMRFGLDMNRYIVNEKKIKRGDTFGAILEAHGIDYPEVHLIVQKVKKKVNLRRLQKGKGYTLLYNPQDSLNVPEYFIYHPNVMQYSIIRLRDSIYGQEVQKPIELREKEASGVIQNSLYETMLANGLDDDLSFYMADIYAWTIDFFRLHKGDRFKVIYDEKYVDDTLAVGISKIKAAYFEHRGKGQYAFEFQTDSLKGIVDYFDDSAKNLRRAFLRAPVAFSRISSRYNLKRRIAYYGNKIRPHRGTDFAAAVGTPIMSTAHGTVVKSSYTRGNGNYVTVRHNNIYSTQYLHMKRRKVRVGQYVKQGDIIGWVGMTGNTSGPHVCYRFWKYGKQVDPFKQKLPEAKPIDSSLRKRFFDSTDELKQQLDCISYLATQEQLTNHKSIKSSKNNNGTT